MLSTGKYIGAANPIIAENMKKAGRRNFIYFCERPRSAAPDRRRERCRERSDQAPGVTTGRGSLDRLVRIILVLDVRYPVKKIEEHQMSETAAIISDPTRSHS
jgi:hypothetical protein